LIIQGRFSMDFSITELLIVLLLNGKNATVKADCIDMLKTMKLSNVLIIDFASFIFSTVCLNCLRCMSFIIVFDFRIKFLSPWTSV
jgi:hypothetical protein